MKYKSLVSTGTDMAGNYCGDIAPVLTQNQHMTINGPQHVAQ
jgi:hypothetical protein